MLGFFRVPKLLLAMLLLSLVSSSGHLKTKRVFSLVFVRYLTGFELILYLSRHFIAAISEIGTHLFWQTIRFNLHTAYLFLFLLE